MECIMFAWTEDHIARLKMLWLEGRTAETIARELGPGISRSAVLGKVYRMGLAAQRVAPDKPRPRPRLRPAWQSIHGQAGRAKKTERRSEVLSALGPLSPSARGTRSILTVGRSDCRWPIGDPPAPEFSLCGRRVSRGAYCADHAAIAYSGAPRPSESLIRWASVS